MSVLDRHKMMPEQVSFNPDRFKNDFHGEQSLEQWWCGMATVKGQGSTYDAPLSFAWRRKRMVKSNGYITHRVHNNAGKLVPASISLKAPWDHRVDWASLFKDFIGIFPPQIAMLHLFTERETGRGGPWSSFEIGSFGAALDPTPPNLAWSMFFGDEFAGHGQRDQMRELGFGVEDHPNGYRVEVTDQLNDVEDRFGYFSSRRSVLKGMYPPTLFSIDSEPY
jgi:hypothetical protein